MRHFRSVFRNVLVFTVTCLSTVFFPRVDGGRGEVRLQVPAMRAAVAREAGGSPCSHAAPRACGGSVALARARSRRRVSCRVVAAAGTQGKRARRLRARARPERRAGPGCWRPAGGGPHSAAGTGLLRLASHSPDVSRCSLKLAGGGATALGRCPGPRPRTRAWVTDPGERAFADATPRSCDGQGTPLGPESPRGVSEWKDGGSWLESRCGHRRGRGDAGCGPGSWTRRGNDCPLEPPGGMKPCALDT